MINLLPSEPEQVLHATYRGRLLVAIGFLFSALLLMALIIVGMLYWTVTGRQGEVAAALAKEKAGTAIKAGAALEAELKLFGREATLLSGMASSTTFTAVVQDILINKTPGISIADISYAATGRMVRLAGIAETRDKLLGFIDVLRNDPLFVMVDSPVSNLIKDREAEFVINLQVHE